MDAKQVKEFIENINKLDSQQDTEAWVERQGNIQHMIQRADESRAKRAVKEIPITE